MGITTVPSRQIRDADVNRDDLDTTTVGKAVVRKLIQGTGISLSATGADAGTGDVTINAAGGGLTLTTFEKDLGAIALKGGSFDLTGLSGLTADKQVIANQAHAAYTGKGTLKDEAEMDQAFISGYVLSATSIRFRWFCGRFGALKGNVKFNYAVSA